MKILAISWLDVPQEHVEHGQPRFAEVEQMGRQGRAYHIVNHGGRWLLRDDADRSIPRRDTGVVLLDATECVKQDDSDAVDVARTVEAVRAWLAAIQAAR